MEIILKQDVENLGFKNDIVKVREGYGRNYLIPNGLAVIATDSSKKVLSETLRQRAHKEEKLVKEARETADKLVGVKVSVVTKAGEKGRIFGSVNNIQLSAALKEKGFEIDRKNIQIKDENIKQLGTYQAQVRLYKNIESTISFEVIAEEEK